MNNDSDSAARDTTTKHSDTQARTALVLGGGSEIAAAIVAEQYRLGLKRVVLAARDIAAAESTVRSAAPNLEISTIQWDATDIDAHATMVDEAFERLGTVDLVLCGVGMLGHHAGISMEPEDVDLMVRTNFAGPAAALSLVAPRLISQGSGTIVVLSSVAALRARRSNYVYGSSKAGLDVFAQGMGDAMAGSGARVLVVRPGFVKSKMTTGLDPAPFSTEPSVVAQRVAVALRKQKETVSAPSHLGPMFAVLRNTPRRLWRKIAGDR